MKAIYKYRLTIADEQTIELPQYAKILCVGTQLGKLYLWALVNTEATLNEMRDFEVFGTGNPVDENTESNRYYLGTCFVKHFVWHIFERIN